ncbi:MAG TPA: hypothetical protein VJI75_01600 [Candidatus Nanoarchaeia archaeon]|nr:hypothetical protein [Candidatus Nanoarchaeia archaeon]
MLLGIKLEVQDAERRNISLSSIFLLFILAASLSLSSSAVSAIGISTGQLPSLYVFEPGKEITFQMTCYEYTNDCEVYSEGDLSEATVITPLKQTDEDSKNFIITIKIPATEPNPGRHALYIVASDVKSQIDAGISVLTRVRKSFVFMVLYGSPYIEAALSVHNINEGEEGRLIFSIINYGKYDLGSVYGTADIYNSEGVKVGRAMTGSHPIKSTEGVTLTAFWNSSGNKGGDYLAVGKIYYDGSEAYLNQSFLIGQKVLSLVNHTKDFEVGKISRMDILLKNEWNGPIDSAFATVILNGTVSKTPSVSFFQFQTQAVSAYIDTSPSSPGEHEVLFTLSFDGFYKEVKGTINVFKSEEPEPYMPFGLGMNTTTLLVITIVLLVLLNLFMMFIHKRNKEHKKPEQSASDNNSAGQNIIEQKREGQASNSSGSENKSEVR